MQAWAPTYYTLLVASLVILNVLNAKSNDIISKDMCTIDCSVFDSPEYFPCATDFPTINPVFRDFISNNNEDILALANLGVIVNQCSDLIVTASDLVFQPMDCNDSLRIQRIYTVVDGQTTIAECTRTFITLTPPIRIMNHAQDTVVRCTDNVDVIFNDWVNNFGFSDVFECTGISMTNTLPMNPVIFYGDCRTINNSPPVDQVIGDVRVQWDFFDDCGTKVSTIASFLVVDDIAPEVMCPPSMTFSLGEENLIQNIESNLADVTAIETCDDFRIENDFNPNSILYDCTLEQNINVNFTAIDSCQNMANCQTTLTIINDAQPTIDCPDMLMLECQNPDNLMLVEDWINTASGQDNLGNELIINTNFDNSFLSNTTCFIQFNLTFSVTDACGRSASCMVPIAFEDTTPPEVFCPSPLTINISLPNFLDTIDIWTLGFTSTDGCNNANGNVDQSYRDFIFECSDQEIIVEYESVDECTNTNTCTSSIIVTNDYNSDITCPAPLDLICGQNDIMSTLQDWLNSVDAFDNIGNTYLVENNLDLSDPDLLTCSNPIEVVFSAEGFCGEILTCTQSFMVSDTESPTIACPPDITIVSDPTTLDQDIQSWLDSSFTSDNCGVNQVVNSFSNDQFDGCELSISNNITFTVSDICGNTNSCLANLTIETDRLPQVNCLPNLTIECGDINNNDLINDWINSIEGEDFSGLPLNVNNDYSPNNLNQLQCSAELLITFDVIDNCNWTDTCRTSIVLMDTTPPDLICPPRLEVNSTQPDLTTTINDWLESYTSSDNCLGSSVTHNGDVSTIDLCDPPLVVSVQYNAIDTCQLTSNCETALAFSSLAPQLSCPGDFILECGDPDNEDIINDFFAFATATDNNGQNLVVNNDFDISVITNTCFEETTVTFQTEDSCQQTNTCLTTITINDSNNPIVSCPNDLNLLSGDPNKISKFEDYIDALVIDDCNSIQISTNLDTDLLVFSCDDILTLPFNITVTDDCNNSSSCDANVIITNNVAADINCPSTLQIECGQEDRDQVISNWLQLTVAEDNAGNSFPVDNDFSINNPELASCNGNIDVQFEMIDLCNAALTCSSTIEIRDFTPPDIVCPNDTLFVFEDPDFNVNVNLWLTQSVAMDNCGQVTVTDNFDPNVLLENCEQEVIIPVIFNAADDCGFTEDCSSQLTIQTIQLPTISCPAALIVECGNTQNESLINDWIRSTIGLDFNGNLLAIESDFQISEFNILTCNDTLDVNILTRDDCDFIADCVSEIVIEDTTVPIIVCPQDLTVNSANMNATIEIESWLMGAQVNDNCTLADLSNNFDLSNIDICSGNTSNLIEFTGSDMCGLTSNCQSILTINKDLPQLSCPQDLTIECGLDQVTIDSNIQNSIQEASAFDNNGIAVSALRNDYISGSLIPDCSSSMSITVVAEDNCMFMSDCIFNVSIEDTTAPIMSCPPESSFDLNSANLLSLIQNWLESLNVVEACNSFTTSNDLVIEIDDIDCDSSFEVLFQSEDECNNSSECLSTLSFLNNNEVTIECPQPISIKCSEFEDSEIDIFLSEVMVNSIDSVMVFNDYTQLGLDCADVFEQVITFEAEDICGNMDMCTTTITYIPDGKAYIPNMFSPNGDGNNDYFTLFGNEFISNINSLKIYSRWGELVFSKENLTPGVESEGWDGRYNNDSVVQDLYIYVIEYVDDRGNIFNETGSVQVLR